MEHLSQKGSLRELGLFSLEKKVPWWDLSNLDKYLMGETRR